jgi:tRNA 2-selenouridine synthase
VKFQYITTTSQLADFDEIIDVRSPAEFAEDHVPGALSCPVLDNEERARIGTMYKQESPFAAKKFGAALVARNIARHIEEKFLDRGKQWRPLVYCWRGGKRSGAMTHILREIGWNAGQLDGGYRAYRREIIARLIDLPPKFNFRVICGATGNAKSRLLAALAQAGAQVLDLEELASHRGSVLGNLPQQPQPAQKLFESLVWDRLRQFNPDRMVYVEAESRRIGLLQVPGELLTRMRASPCLLLDAPVAERVSFLMSEYGHYLSDPRDLKSKLAMLKGLHSDDTIERWFQLIDGQHWKELVADLLQNHYDPAYHRATLKNFPQLPEARTIRPTRLDGDSLRSIAAQVMAVE